MAPNDPSLFNDREDSMSAVEWIEKLIQIEKPIISKAFIGGIEVEVRLLQSLLIPSDAVFGLS